MAVAVYDQCIADGTRHRLKYLNNKVMRYYNYEQKSKAPSWLIRTLENQFGFDYTNWGCNILFDNNGEVDVVEICKLSNANINKATWTHYANIQKTENGWEVNTQFNGENEDEMWVYKYYTRFVGACAYVRRGKLENPIKKY